MDGRSFLDSAMDQPFSMTGTFFDTVVGGLRATSIGELAARVGRENISAPTTPGVIDAQGQLQTDPTYVENAGDAVAAGWSRQETAPELEARRTTAGALSESAFKESPFYREGVQWDAGMTSARAEAIADDYDRRKIRESYAEQRPITSFLGGAIGSIPDPFNFIPFAGPAVRAAAVGKLGRLGGAAATGALDAAVGSAVSDLGLSGLRDDVGEETTFQSVVSNMAVSAVIGAGFGTLGGVLKNRADARTARLQAAAEDRLGTLIQTQEGRVTLDEAIRQVAAGDAVDLSPTSAGFIQSAATRAFDFVKEVEADPRLFEALPERPARASTALDPHRVAVADGSSIDVSPRVVEARDLLTSADQGYDATLQPRERDRAAAQAQVRQIAAALDPQRLGASSEADRGAPIVGPDRMVESGNGRVQAIRQAYAEGGPAAERYRAYLAAQGVDVSRYDQPVLVRERQTPLDAAGRQAFTVAANRPATLAMSATERAKADAAALTPDTLGLIRNADDLSAAANADFVRQFMRALPATETGALATAEGRLSAEGLGRVKNAVLATAYGDADTLARITEATDDGVKSISKALTSAAPEWARLRSDVAAGRVPAALDVTSDLLEAVKRTADLRGKGGKLDDYLKQIDAFNAIPDSVQGFMRLFYDVNGRRAAGADKISDALRFYALEARKVTTDDGLDLGLNPVQSRDLIAAANVRRGGDDGSDAGLFGAEVAGNGADAPSRGGAAFGPDADGGGRGNGQPGGNGLAGRAGSPDDARTFFDAAPERDLETLYREIPRHQAALDDAGRAIEADMGAKFRTPGLKDREGAAAKMARKGYRSTRQLTDLVRGGFVAKSTGQADDIVARLAQRFDVMDEGWSTTPGGYLDRKVLLRFDDGTVGEVQLWEPNFLDAKSKGGGHKLYVEQRGLQNGDPRILELEEKMRGLYAEARSKAGAAWSEVGTGGRSAPNVFLKSDSDISTPLSETSAKLTGDQSSPASRMANANGPDSTAGLRSQSTNLGVSDIGRTLPPTLDMGKAAPVLSPDERSAVEQAAERVGKSEDYKALAEQFGIDPRTGDFPERAEVDQVREEGRLTDDDEVELADAEKAFELGDAYGAALRASVGCLL